ncbi:MAG: phosphate:sodium symporter [Flavobacteriaceae bacterium CG2_30_34_30]|nr:MAG: phosphate:sodium symporter [Flavobacteriaceae bacterium CG2_30_34_30]PIQ19389.1 MAG: phosphate:sodium symporter [Flavobacteriaceae bacterium CG18_big_fil_WC_8_21_14_2_50_34_36]PIV50371.1 MAG: phosphate:sodium symporter [Flavobacteriaceae bacterium CG02_land_8_20_14_3_00_34_13]PJC06020.1 MAG: phosphate:sodium symporter [Flavobacteriaceae bacterium CG_4_9_14_0_8_um_filter_34_30]
MNDMYLIMIIALGILAIADLVVGVSNDAVNFLNSAIGSKAVSFKIIMIVASVGIFFGAVSSSGMMEIARSGIFVPSEFYFNEIMIICMAVMIADILLLDFFNSLGLPTSTTVSIVFELLGAAVCMALLKIYHSEDTFSNLGNYINSEKALEIIIGILLSVVIAFTVGAIVQFITRYLVSFHFEKKPSYVPAIFGGIGITAIFYFIIIKGLKGTAILPEQLSIWANSNLLQFLFYNFLIWGFLSFLLKKLFQFNVYKLIIILGTFALAMAFAGNDLVNFIGVPIAAYQGYEAWAASGIAANTFNMAMLANKVGTPIYLLLLAGLVMVLTLWFSEKAQRVVKTSVDLSRQNEGKERFHSNILSQQLVRIFIVANKGLVYILPNKVNESFIKQFKKPKAQGLDKKIDAPAFDMIRAAVNLMIASLLISFATSLKLPLSTTYVTFMVAMGTSLADRAWGSDSAVYRVAGVLNVIGGWFMTAIVAFFTAAVLAFIIFIFGEISLIFLFSIAIILIIRTYLRSKKVAEELKEDELFRKAESTSIQGVIEESSANVSTIMKRASKVYAATIEGLAKQDAKILKNAKKYTAKLDGEVEDLKDHIFYYIKNIEGHDVGASRFYLLVQDNLQDISQSLELITKASLKHVKNNHKGLKFNQIKDLKEIENKLLDLFQKTRKEFDKKSLQNIGPILEEKQKLFDYVSLQIEKQIERTKDPDSSSKNSVLYFTLLLETKDLIASTLEMLELYYSEHQNAKMHKEL